MLFVFYNGVVLDDVVILEVVVNIDVVGIVQVIYYVDGDQLVYCNMCLEVVFGIGSCMMLIEQYLGWGLVFINVVIVIEICDNVYFSYYWLQSEVCDSLYIGILLLCQSGVSCIDSYQLMVGSWLCCNDVCVFIDKSGVELNMNGIFVVCDCIYIDNQLCVEYWVLDCIFNQVYWGLVGEKGKVIFNGCIYIYFGVSGILVELSNKNLLFNSGVEIDIKLELEIYNDDVKCVYGVIVGQLDVGQQFYLQVCGVLLVEVKCMFSLGFVNELVMVLFDQVVVDWVQFWLVGELGQSWGVDEEVV